jgi:hypothetical protein
MSTDKMREALVPGDTAVGQMANTLFNAWGAAEPKHNVTLYPESYKATFLDMARAALAAPTAEPQDAREFKPLTDHRCDEFRRLPVPFNDMVRAIYEAGVYETIGRANEEIGARYAARYDAALASQQPFRECRHCGWECRANDGPSKKWHPLDQADGASQNSPQPRLPAEWHEDTGPVLWWHFPIEEPPYVGTPLDDAWPGYHTHWTPIQVPAATADGVRNQPEASK